MWEDSIHNVRARKSSKIDNLLLWINHLLKKYPSCVIRQYFYKRNSYENNAACYDLRLAIRWRGLRFLSYICCT